MNKKHNRKPYKNSMFQSIKKTITPAKKSVDSITNRAIMQELESNTEITKLVVKFLHSLSDQQQQIINMLSQTNQVLITNSKVLHRVAENVLSNDYAEEAKQLEEKKRKEQEIADINSNLSLEDKVRKIAIATLKNVSVERDIIEKVLTVRSKKNTENNITEYQYHYKKQDKKAMYQFLLKRIKFKTACFYKPFMIDIYTF